MRRSVGIAFGIGNHILFAITVWRLFWFLKGSESLAPSSGSLLTDLGLAIFFVIPHSFLLLPVVRQRITKLLPDAFYGSLFCVVTCVSLLVVFANWQLSPTVVWQLDGVGCAIVEIAFYASWVALFYSLSLTGLGYQTGWTPWWYWVRGKPLPAREFEPRGAYLWLRHPVYLSFLGLIWFVPVMTADRAVLTATWSVYIYCGSWLKDQRLIHFLGDHYLQYQADVPGYPGVFLGPLARVPKTFRGLDTLQIATQGKDQSAERKAG
jgi:methanethiol S-methyltransferase